MKELSIEEKAKAYDEAIKRVNDLISRCKTNRDRRTMIYRVDDIESIFPELKESEDERIRKAIIKYLDALDDDEIRYGVSFKDMRVWLEKQGEQILANSAKTCKDERKPGTIFLKFRIGDKVTNGEDTYTINSIDKDCYWVKEHDCATIPFEYQHLWKLVEQKLAWSEEDEENSKNILYILNQLKGNAIYNEDKIAENCIDWLKALKERVQPQPKQEWSEEDIRKIKLICTYLDAYKSYQTPVGTKYIDGCISWTNALIERVGCKANCTTMWKPSEEQMDILCKVSTYGVLSSSVRDVLQSLYNDLKKL